MVRMMGKSRARRTLNDTPLPKVNWYLSHICFLRFSTFSLHLICFSPLHVWNFQNYFLHAVIFLAFFPFYKKTKNIFWVLKSLEKNNLDIFSSKLLAVHHISKVHNRWGSIWPKGGTRGPTLGPADPTGRPTQGQRLLGPTFSNGSIAVVACLSSGARAIFSLNRGREGCWALSCSHTHSHSLSHILARVSIGFWLKFGFKKSHFFAARSSAHLKEQFSGKNFIFIPLT